MSNNNIEYFGFMVNTLTGGVDDLHCVCDYKPQHETCGFSFAKWFTTETQRDKIKSYTKERISFVQEQNKQR